MPNDDEFLEPFYCLDTTTCHTDCMIQVDRRNGKRTIDEKVLSCLKAQCGLMPACIFVHPHKDIILTLDPRQPFGKVEAKL
jgi:hypothetical protein